MAIRVLLVDDEEPFRTTLAKVLRGRGMLVAEAGSGEEALERLRQAPADVAVVDLRMPGLDGIATLERIARGPEAPAVVILTGHGTVEAGIRAVRALAFDFLLKPVRVAALVGVIQAAAEARAGP